jgi:sec-independent protein translocase protein TatB
LFDIGFWEIAVIGVIALLVVGPERLPALARNVGRWVGQVRRYVTHVKQDIEREIHADEVRDLLENPDGLASIRDVARETAEVFDETRKELHDVAANIDSTSSPDPPPEAVPDALGQATNADSAVVSTAVSKSPDNSPTSPADGDSAASTSNDSPADEQRTGQPGQH